MQYPFPGPRELADSEYGAYFWILHVALLVLALASLGSIFISVRRAPQWWEPVVWVLAMVLAGVFASWLGRIEGSDHFAVGYVLFVVGICLIGLAVWGVRKYRQSSFGANIVIVLTCLATLGCIIGMLLPATPSVREAARRADCANGMRDVGLALNKFHDATGLPLDSILTSDGNPPRSWRVEILPFLERDSIKDKYVTGQSWDSAANTPVAKMEVSEFTCPSNWNLKDDKNRYYSHVSAVTGPKTCFENGKGMPLDQIPDGSSNTIMLVEAAGQQIVWTEPRDVDIGKDPIGLNLPGDRPHTSPGWGSSYHNAGINVVYADGSIRNIPRSIDSETLRQLMTASGGEANDDDWLDR